MRKYKTVPREVLDDVLCDVCGASCKNDCASILDGASLAEYATLEGAWGYCSRQDGNRYLCEMCEVCFEKVSAYIESIKKSS
jgi:hypothetical protein